MDDEPEIRSSELSRRGLILRGLALTAGGAAVLAASANVNQAAAQTKVTQKAVKYQDTPKGALRCDNCTQFEAPASCKTVEGSISPAGWCMVYVKKPA